MTTLVPNQEFSHPAAEERVKRTAAALEANGMHVIVLASREEARSCVLEIIPSGTEVYNPPSRTLEQIGLAGDIEHSTTFQPLRARAFSMDRKTQRREIRRLIASPDVVVGSVHAITEQGQVLIASASGSQLGAAVFGAGTVIWVVGTQKLVPTLEEGFRRIREYSHPLEDARTREAYGQASAINKILVVNGEQPGRITVVLVKEELGF
jgi:L-lactate utilization protein LutB